METKLERLRRIEALEREHRRAMFGWNHPLNAEWAARRADEDRGGRDEDWQRWVEDQLAYLKDLLRDLEQQGRSSGGEHRHDAVDRHVDEPLVIRRRGEGGQPHAK